MFDHIDFAVTDLARSREFYSCALKPLGVLALIEIGREHEEREGSGFGIDGRPMFRIGKSDALRGRLHVAFSPSSRSAIDSFRAAAVAAGEKDNGAPALRPRYHKSHHAAFVLDPDGHNIEAVCHTE